MEINLILTAENYNKHFDIIVNNESVGWISFRENKDSISLESINLYTTQQRKGIGTALIKQLLLKYRTIYAFSSPLAVGLWKKVGAEFEYNVTDEMIYELLDIGEYPPFSINL